MSEVFSIIFISIGLIYLVALFSHYSGENPWSGDTALRSNAVNSAGVIGAYLSDISLSIFGYSSYLIPLALIWLGYNIHKNIGTSPNPRSVFIIRFVAFYCFGIFYLSTFIIRYTKPIRRRRLYCRWRCWIFNASILWWAVWFSVFCYVPWHYDD